ncbi:MAG TPA: UDP-N-acetylmuramoyl-tripeptide--D-alanyl-D-alanine ligase [Candidatus Omnitrophota bacterium]|nr:UDP-N-acetylmuramoyl-tripeptide--D-alanyl-D-alanine ligase [Candidatus Omnitrophota bacterium]
MLTSEDLEAALEISPPGFIRKTVFKGISIDSRTLTPGDVFFAIQGPRFDGHSFLKEARGKGAVAFVVNRSAVSDADLSGYENVFPVSDTTRALGQVSNYYRRQRSVRSIAVTGSAGKTTTKEFCHLLLSKRYSVHATSGNLNNQFGLPLTVFRLKPEHQILLAEMGASRSGDIAYLCGIAEPDIGIVTNVYPAHLEGFGSLGKVYDAKLELGAAVAKRNGTLIVNGDDEELVRRAKKFGVRLLTFGRMPGNDFRMTDVARTGEAVCFRVNQRDFFEIPTPAVFNADNFLAAMALAVEMEISSEDIREALKAFRPVAGRFEIRDLRNGVRVVYDAYNANPGAVLRSLESFSALRGDRGRMIAVLGDMKELGPESCLLHREVGRSLKRFGLDALLSVGPESGAIAEGARRENACGEIRHFPNNEEVRLFLSSFAKEGDMIFLKGSRSMKLEEVLDGLEACGL